MICCVKNQKVSTSFFVLGKKSRKHIDQTCPEVFLKSYTIWNEYFQSNVIMLLINHL